MRTGPDGIWTQLPLPTTWKRKEREEYKLNLGTCSTVTNSYFLAIYPDLPKILRRREVCYGTTKDGEEQKSTLSQEIASGIKII